MGPAKKITFNIFDPRRVEEVLNEDLVSAWREDDAMTKAEDRKWTDWKVKATRMQRQSVITDRVSDTEPEDVARHQLKGWEEFERDGLLR